MYLISFLVFLGLVYRAIGLTIVEPNNGTVWTTNGPNAILWTYEANDPKKLIFQLVHNNSTFYPIPNLLTTDGIIESLNGVDLTSNVLMVEWDESYKGSPSLPNGAGYSLNVLYNAHKGSQTFLNVSQGTFSILTATVEPPCNPAISSPTPSKSCETELAKCREGDKISALLQAVFAIVGFTLGKLLRRG